MKFTYNDIEYTFPSSLKEITLGQRIAFYEQYGKELDVMAGEVEAISDVATKDAEFYTWQLKFATCFFSFYANIPIEEVRNNMDIFSLLEVYFAVTETLNEDAYRQEVKTSFEWNGDIWTLSSHEVTPVNKMTFNEFLHGKEVTRQLEAMGKGEWDRLPYLCAIYLRKKNEPFTEDLVAENSERMKLILSLPLDIAVAVGFFLTSILNIYTTISAYSGKGSQGALTRPATSINGDG